MHVHACVIRIRNASCMVEFVSLPVTCCPPPGRADAAGSVGLSDGEWVGVTALWNSDESPSPPCTLQKYTKDLYVYKMTH